MTQAAHTPSKPVNEYLRTRVLTASPEELRLMLLDGAIKFTNQAREGLLNKNHEAVFTGLTNGRNIVTELLTTIRDEPNPALAEQVRALYAFIYKMMVEAGFEKDVPKLDKVIELLQFERETWVMLMQRLTADRATPSADTPAEHRPTFSIQG